MSAPSPDASLRELFELFAGAVQADPPPVATVPSDALPQSYQRLLVHENHMTLALEEFFGKPVRLHVIARRQRDKEYARMILLSLDGTNQFVEFGIVRLRLDVLNDEVRSEILAGVTPLGRILVEHDVLRRIQPTHYLEITPHEQLRGWLGITSTEPIYGRLATIYCDGLPAIDLLEVVYAP